MPNSGETSGSQTKNSSQLMQNSLGPLAQQIRRSGNTESTPGEESQAEHGHRCVEQDRQTGRDMTENLFSIFGGIEVHQEIEHLCMNIPAAWSFRSLRIHDDIGDTL